MTNKPTFTMMCGLPGSGKSTFASELSKLQHSIVYSSDKIREELYGDEDSQDNNCEVFKVLHKRIKNSLRKGESVIYDATNINSKRRRAFLSELRNIDCQKSCVIVATPYSKCIKRNANRLRNIPVEVIKRMYMNWNTPYYFEGWDKIHIIRHSYGEHIDVFDWWYKMRRFNQDNPHHDNSLGIHCLKVAEGCNDNDLIMCAGFVHDCGKPFTKTFTNCKGEDTESAHYYNHQNIGAYNSFFFDYPDNMPVLDVSILVNLHMQPYFWEKDKENGEKIREKFKRLWGNKLYDDVIKLHKADVESQYKHKKF